MRSNPLGIMLFIGQSLEKILSFSRYGLNNEEDWAYLATRLEGKLNSNDAMKGEKGYAFSWRLVWPSNCHLGFHLAERRICLFLICSFTAADLPNAVLDLTLLLDSGGNFEDSCGSMQLLTHLKYIFKMYFHTLFLLEGNHIYPFGWIM